MLRLPRAASKKTIVLKSQNGSKSLTNGWPSCLQWNNSCRAMKRSTRLSHGEMKPGEIGTSPCQISFVRNYSIAAYSSKIRGSARGGGASNRRKTSQHHYGTAGSEGSRDY